MRKFTAAILTCSIVTSSAVVAAETAITDDLHPMMTDKHWVNVGKFFADRDLDASVTGGMGDERTVIDFESQMGLDDKPDLLMSELGWQFGEEWGLSLQYFRADRSATETLEERIEWEDLVFEAGAEISAATKISVTRLFFSRRFWDGGRHSVRLGAGVHLFKTAASIGGDVTIDDITTEYKTSAVSASIPVPDIGIWYRYSPSNRWMLYSRLDWFSADLGGFAGSVWNFAAGANLQITEHLGIGLSYQLFEIDGRIRKKHWRGSFRTRLTGPNLHITGYW
jgi:hypothetical protein